MKIMYETTVKNNGDNYEVVVKGKSPEYSHSRTRYVNRANWLEKLIGIDDTDKINNKVQEICKIIEKDIKRVIEMDKYIDKWSYK